jgi:hypothetical protein
VVEQHLADLIKSGKGFDGSPPLSGSFRTESLIEFQANGQARGPGALAEIVAAQTGPDLRAKGGQH